MKVIVVFLDALMVKITELLMILFKFYKKYSDNLNIIFDYYTRKSVRKVGRERMYWNQIEVFSIKEHQHSLYHYSSMHAESGSFQWYAAQLIPYRIVYVKYACPIWKTVFQPHHPTR